MERVLNQEEIDAMVRRARGKPAEQIAAVARSIKPCSFRQAGQLTGQQSRSMSSLHESFARSLTQSLGAYLRVAFDANLVSVEQLPYSEFLERVPDVTYFVSFSVPEMNTSAAMQIDHSLVFPLVDILLGGTGQCEPLAREVTEIESEIMHGVAQIITRELGTSWASLGLTAKHEDRQFPTRMQHFLSSNEKILCLNFELKMAEAHGTMNVLLPISISNTLLRKLSSDRLRPREHINHPTALRIKEKLLDCRYEVALSIPRIKLPVQAFLSLTSGQLCNLGVPVREPVSLAIAGQAAFKANPVRQAMQRAAQVLELARESDAERIR